MFCSGCGQALPLGQGICPQCGRTVAAPAMPGMEFHLAGYAGKVRTLGILWIVYSGLSLILGTAALTFAHTVFSHHFGPWGGQWPHEPIFFWPFLMHFVWIILVFRSGLGMIAGWGLLERTEWGRILAIVVAFLNIVRLPFGTALGIWTLVVLLGCRNSALYDRI